MWRVLLVDECPETRAPLGSALSRAGFNVAVCGHASEALGLLRRVRFDAVVVEYELQDEGGVQVLDEAAALQPKALRILMTRDPALDVERLRRDALFHDHLLKPFTAVEIVQMLHVAMSMDRGIS